MTPRAARGRLPAPRPSLRAAAGALAPGVAAGVILLAACTGVPAEPSGTSAAAPGSAAAQVPPGAGQPTVAGRIDAQLHLPWSTVFLPDGTAVISERDSALLRSIGSGSLTAGSGAGSSGSAGRAGIVGQVPDVVPGGEGGLLGLALSPDFPTDRYLYAYFTAAGDNRIARMRLEGSGAQLRLGPAEVIFTGIPKASTHNGGRIRFGPDGYLYVGTGDSQRRDQAQNTDSLAGKILRITAEGRPAPGNPFGDNPVYSLGHRNVQGLAWDGAGRLWASEFGPEVNDELNLIVPGGNYGWPEVTGAPHRSALIDAKVVWPSTAESSPSGLEIVGDTAYLGALRGQRVWTVPLAGEFAGDPVSYFTQQYGRIRNISVAPDGRLWVLSNNQNPDFVLVLDLHP